MIKILTGFGIGLYALYKMGEKNSIGAIYDPNRDYNFMCTDGVFSDKSNGCKTHGGISKDQ